MGISVRRYLFPEKGEPTRISQRVADGLIFGSDAIPEYAESRQRILTVILESVDRRPIEIVEATGRIWVFDNDGKIKEGLLDAFREVMNSMPTPTDSNGKVVDIRARLSKKRLADRYRWEPSGAELDRIALDIWPDGKSGPMKAAKGNAPKRPPLTFDAKQALSAATEGFWKVAHEVDGLKEPSLKGFAFEAWERAASDPDFEFLYRALAEMAERRLAILRRRRREKGNWYAVVEVTRWNSEHTQGETIATYYQQCNGKTAAVKAARALLARHAESYAENLSVEASIVSDLEWRDPRYGAAIEMVDGKEVRR